MTIYNNGGETTTGQEAPSQTQIKTGAGQR